MNNEKSCMKLMGYTFERLLVFLGQIVAYLHVNTSCSYIIVTHNFEYIYIHVSSLRIWGNSSVGRARAQHARGPGFDSLFLHSSLTSSAMLHSTYDHTYVTSASFQVITILYPSCRMKPLSQCLTHAPHNQIITFTSTQQFTYFNPLSFFLHISFTLAQQSISFPILFIYPSEKAIHLYFY